MHYVYINETKYPNGIQVTPGITTNPESRSNNHYRPGDTFKVIYTGSEKDALITEKAIQSQLSHFHIEDIKVKEWFHVSNAGLLSIAVKKVLNASIPERIAMEKSLHKHKITGKWTYKEKTNEEIEYIRIRDLFRKHNKLLHQARDIVSNKIITIMKNVQNILNHNDGLYSSIFIMTDKKYTAVYDLTSDNNQIIWNYIRKCDIDLTNALFTNMSADMLCIYNDLCKLFKISSFFRIEIKDNKITVYLRTYYRHCAPLFNVNNISVDGSTGNVICTIYHKMSPLHNMDDNTFDKDIFERITSCNLNDLHKDLLQVYNDIDSGKYDLYFNRQLNYHWRKYDGYMDLLTIDVDIYTYLNNLGINLYYEDGILDTTRLIDDMRERVGGYKSMRNQSAFDDGLLKKTKDVDLENEYLFHVIDSDIQNMVNRIVDLSLNQLT